MHPSIEFTHPSQIHQGAVHLPRLKKLLLLDPPPKRTGGCCTTYTLQGWRTSGKIWSKGHPPFRCCSLSNQNSDIVTYLAIAIITMPDEFNTNETLPITRQPKLGLPLSRIFIWGIPHCVTNQVGHGAREINNVWSPGWHNIISILDYDDGRENSIATTVGLDCNSIIFKVASAAVGDLPRPYRFYNLSLYLHMDNATETGRSGAINHCLNGLNSINCLRLSLR